MYNNSIDVKKITITLTLILSIIILAYSIIYYNKTEQFYNVTVKDTFNLNDSNEVEITDTFKGTPITEILAVETRRFPFVIENVQNWYSTQPLVPYTLGTNMGRL